MDILPPAISVPRLDFVRTLGAPASVGSDPRRANSAPPSTPKPADRTFATATLAPLPWSIAQRQAQLVWTTADNVPHRRGCLMWCQSRNRRPSATSCFQRPTSYAFHQPHPSAHRTSSYPEDSSHLSLRKTFLNCLNDSPPKVFLCFRRQRASILVSHARQTNTLF